MTVTEKNLYIVDRLREREALMRRELSRAQIENAGQVAMRAEWERCNPMDGVGGMSRNPYRGDESHLNTAKVDHQRALESLNHAVDVFIAAPQGRQEPA